MRSGNKDERLGERRVFLLRAPALLDFSQVLDDGSEHQHRFSLTAEVSIVGKVRRWLYCSMPHAVCG